MCSRDDSQLDSKRNRPAEDTQALAYSGSEYANRLVCSLASRLATLGSKKDPDVDALEDFLSVASPSMVWKPCQWVVVQNNNPDSPGKEHANQNITAVEKNAATQRILNVAQAQRFTLGKWIFRFSISDPGRILGRLAVHTAKGILGCSIKMASAEHLRNESFEKVLCCIYVKDFSDSS